MNDTSINIPGIIVTHEIINMQDSTDTANIIVIKDEYGQEIRINTCFGKITDVWTKKK